MRWSIFRRTLLPAEPAQELLEVVTPRTNAAVITPAEHLFGALGFDPGTEGAAAAALSLEIAGDSDGRRFLARAGSSSARRDLVGQLGAAYPQASLRLLAADRDPALVRPGEQTAACTLVLRHPSYLPLRTFRDDEVDAARAAQADPVLGILGAMGDLPAGWRALSQLVLRPAPADWSRDYLRLALEHPLAAERQAGGSGADTSLGSVFALLALLLLGALGLQAAVWYRAHDWPHLALLVLGAVAVVGLLVVALRLRQPRPLHDPKLVQEKVRHDARLVELRLAIVAPASVASDELRARLTRLVAAYRPFTLASGNALVARPVHPPSQGSGQGARPTRDLRVLDPLGGKPRELPILNVRELAGLWHLPQALDDVPLVERTTARRRLPLPATVSLAASKGRGCPIGVSSHQGRVVPVALPAALLRRHMLLVAKTRRGKSTLLLRLARHHMQGAGALILVDPHRDLAETALGLVPPHRRDDVIYLDVASPERPFGVNLLDAGLHWSRDQAVANTLLVFERAFDRFWGPRMADAFRFAAMALFEANEELCVGDPVRGRERQYTVLNQRHAGTFRCSRSWACGSHLGFGLDVPLLLADPPYRRTVLRAVSDPTITYWFTSYFEALDRRLQLEIINPVQTKVHAFAASRAARAIVGQPRSTIDPADWLRHDRIVLLSTGKGEVGEELAALVGGTLLNLATLAIGRQAELPPALRQPVTLLVDEFHTIPSANYEELLSELAKNGAALVLATQSLARLDTLDPERRRGLRATVFANLDGLFAFHVSAEDAAYLAAELGGGLDEQDLLELGDYQCYARLWSDTRGGERLPTFLVRLDPPPRADAALARRLAAASAERYGRPIEAVDEDRRMALERPALARASSLLPQTGPARVGQSLYASSGLLSSGAGDGTPTAAGDRGGFSPGPGPGPTTASGSRGSRRRPSQAARQRAAEVAAGQAALLKTEAGTDSTDGAHEPPLDVPAEPSDQEPADSSRDSESAA